MCRYIKKAENLFYQRKDFSLFYFFDKSKPRARSKIIKNEILYLKLKYKIEI